VVAVAVLQQLPSHQTSGAGEVVLLVLLLPFLLLPPPLVVVAH
jgi:hypothetical protein